jgi:membrane protein YdbS with pleckstrin-like domain
MAKTIKKKNIHASKKSSVSPFSIYWNKANYIFLLAGVATIFLGFYFLSIGPWDSASSLVISPILLFIGYVLIFPASIFFRKKTEQSNTQELQ